MNIIWTIICAVNVYSAFQAAKSSGEAAAMGLWWLAACSLGLCALSATIALFALVQLGVIE